MRHREFPSATSLWPVAADGASGARRASRAAISSITTLSDRWSSLMTQHASPAAATASTAANTTTATNAGNSSRASSEERRRHPRVLQDISEALGWPANYLEGRLRGRQPDGQPREAEALTGESEAFLAKLAFVLERRLGQVVDVIYNNDSNVDITIEIRHSPREH